MHSVSNDNQTRTACELCRCPHTKRIWSLRFPSYPGLFQLWQCHECEVVFNWPRLTDSEISEQYDGDYYVFGESAAQRWSRATQLYLNYLLPIEQERGCGRLLEIGSARGHLLALAKARGWDVQGVEISPQAAQSSTQEFGVSVRSGTLEEQNDNLGLFDVVIAIDVLEHVTSPADFVDAIRQRLKPNGQAILETPNWDSLWRKLGRKNWIGLNRFHLFLFGTEALSKLVERSGFSHAQTVTSTNLAHALWGWRPEVNALTQRLPAGLKWRTERLLNQATPKTPDTKLWQDAPTSLHDSLARIESQRQDNTPRSLSPSRHGDNLAILATI